MKLRQVYRLTTFVPPEHVDTVLDAVISIHPLRYGPYNKSAWWTGPGVEQFEPTEGANPTVGTIGHTERVPTARLEFALPRDADLLERVAKGLIQAHPWECPAVFIDEATIAEPDAA